MESFSYASNKGMIVKNQELVNVARYMLPSQNTNDDGDD